MILAGGWGWLPSCGWLARQPRPPASCHTTTPPQALGFVDLPTLMGVPGVEPDESLLALAQVSWPGAAARGCVGRVWQQKLARLALPAGPVRCARAPLPCRPAHPDPALRTPPLCPPPTPPAARPQGEVLKLDRYKAPRDKLLCLVNV